MKAKVESYVNLLRMRDSGVRLNFEGITDEQILCFCLDEELIDEEIAYLYNTTIEAVRRRRHQAYLNRIHLLQEKVLQDHFVVMSTEEKERDLSAIKSENVKELINQIHGLSNSELDELLDYIIINNKKLSSTMIRPANR
ncbi:MAG: hypothetical protein ACQEP4_09325 [Bacillota bacterium]